ncbi:hypothetical protein Ae201684_011771 [Aphanomyces euteiches]|uniref:Peptidase C1A papain C-terminal domain-containing protein n=1 Tax=Aphanomyces euteiches TaxID=100861 RepID=A0A6G0WTS8_9STRA|nr:hypothetical protein Ae201684_011771 [Aphanomyces euteiches]
MKTSLLFVSMLSPSAVARVAYSALRADQQTDVKDQLAKWKAQFASIANEHGFLPQSTNTESANLLDSHTDDELDRFHNTLQDVAEAQKNNPSARFSANNVFALLTQAEFDKIFKNSFAASNATQAKPESNVEDTTALASSIDWPIWPCWAFSSLGTPEFAHCLATGDLLDLSEQQVVSCDNAQSHGCDGGFPGWAMDFERKGMCLESAYPYTSGQSDVTGTCQTTCEKKALSLGETVQDRGESALMTILNTQPVTVTVESGNPVWRNYEGGLVTQCPGAESDHAVIAVGYGTNSDGDYFKIKNSWGTWWGDNGYIYLQRGVGGKGMCNLADFIYYPDLKTAPTTNAPPPSTDDPTSVPTITPSPSTVPPTPTSTPATPAPSKGVTGMQGQLLSQTNKIRAAHSLNPVTWDAALSAKLQKFADSCPGYTTGGVAGWQNYGGYQPCTGDACLKIVGAAWSWYNQAESYWNYSSRKCSSNCITFTNMMSPGVTKIGCGWSKCGNDNLVWCNYVTAENNPNVPTRSLTKDQLKASLTA